MVEEAKPRGDSSAGVPPPLLSIRGLSYAYRHRSHGLFGKRELKPVLGDLDLEIRRGEIFGLLGESGSGKSTLARCVLGLLDYQGEILIEGRPLRGPGPAPGGRARSGAKTLGVKARRLERARLAQMIFQDPGASLNPVKRIGMLLEEPLLIHRRGGKEERAARVDEILFRVGLDPSYKKRRAGELSGGQKQRVCVGRALILEPRLLIADEAISSLDVSVGAQILNLFRELHESLGLGILFISHNAGAVEYLCHRAALLWEGRITEPWSL